MSNSAVPSKSSCLVDDLPDDLLQACFARLPLLSMLRLKAVSKRWLRLSEARGLYLLRKSMGFTQPFGYMLTSKFDEHGQYAGLQITCGEIKLHSHNADRRIGVHRVNDGELVDIRSIALLQGPPRLQFAATAAADGRLLYIVGGRSPLFSGRPESWVVSRQVDVYDPVINRWFQAQPMQTARYAFAMGAFMFADDDRPGSRAVPRLIVAGGYDSQGHALASAELYDAISDAWEPLPCMDKLGGACRGEFTRGKFFVKMANNGPSAIETFDPTLRSWSTPATQQQRSSHKLAFDSSPGAIIFEL